MSAEHDAVHESLPRAWGAPPLRGVLRAQPEDFVVEEVLGYAADGAGEHVLLSVQKREANTAWVARKLAEFADVDERAVAWAGRKDRHALTTQALSVHLPGRPDPDWSALNMPGVRVLGAQRHGRKLKRGALAGNRFVLRISKVQGDRAMAEQRLLQMQARGAPNYFGVQRFGRGGDNIDAARRMFAGRRVPRAEREMLLSAARAQLFNAVLARRVAQANWNCALDGELWALSGSRAWFGPEPFDALLEQRLAAFDIAPSGPLWGRGPNPAGAACAQLEHAALAAYLDLAEGLAAAGLEHARRALRLDLRGMSWHWHGDDALELSFTLPAGAYATAVVQELLDDAAAQAALGDAA
ncbi:tRNA pseudouridine(13) synthase TruD [Metallibacterium sp.]